MGDDRSSAPCGHPCGLAALAAAGLAFVYRALGFEPQEEMFVRRPSR